MGKDCMCYPGALVILPMLDGLVTYIALILVSFLLGAVSDSLVVFMDTAMIGQSNR